MHCERTGEASSNGALFRQADAAQSDIACQMRGALSRQSARCQRSLLPRLAQAVRSTDRRERTVEDGALRTGSQDSPRNIASFARGPLPNDPQRGAHAVGSGCFSSFQFRNACLGKTGCDFFNHRPLRADRIFTYTRIHRAPDCARHWREVSISNRDVIYSSQIVG